MAVKSPSIINIAIVGGGTYCTEVLEKTAVDFRGREATAGFRAVADTDQNSRGILLAKKMGLKTYTDYHDLYRPDLDINLIILLTPEQDIFDNILASRPPHIRILSYHVFEIFWKAIGLEEEKLRERSKEMETILNGIQDFILVVDPDKNIVNVNEAFLIKMGYSREKLIGAKCFKVFKEVSNNKYNICDTSCPINEIMQTGRPAQLILDQVDRRGQPRYIEVSIHPILEKDGKITKFIEISRDITVRLKEEEEITNRLEHMVEERTRQLQETHDKLLHQDKMSSLGKLAASVVHEINNPISGILNLTLLSKRIIEEGSFEQEDIDKFKQYLDLMEKETRRTSRIVTNLLTFSRQTKLELATVNINTLIDHTLLLNANLLKICGVKVYKQLDQDLPDLEGSSDQLQQVFMNFISNAAEAMEPLDKGTLTIKTEYSKKDKMIFIRFIDTGIGIPKENRSRLFEPFFTTKKGKGAGLGLSVVYGILREHGGSIEIVSEVGKGSTFIVELPLNQDGP